MSSNKGQSGVTAVLGSAVVAAMIGALGMTAGSLQAAPDRPADPAVQVTASGHLLRDCGAPGSSTRRFVVERAGGGTRNIDICGDEARAGPSTARALSAAIDAAPPYIKITSDPRTLDILDLRLARARTEMDIRMNPGARERKLGEIDDSIKQLEFELSRTR